MPWNKKCQAQAIFSAPLFLSTSSINPEVSEFQFSVLLLQENAV